MFSSPGDIQRGRTIRRLRSALEGVYSDTANVENVLNLVTTKKTPGKVLAIFYWGRSGSMLLHSMFESDDNPHVLTVPQTALIGFETSCFPDQAVKDLNKILDSPMCAFRSSAVQAWATAALQRMPVIQRCLDAECGSFGNAQSIFCEILSLQLMLRADQIIDHEDILKAVFISFRSALGIPIAGPGGADPLFVWQAHVPLWGPDQWPTEMPYQPRRAWLHAHFPNLWSLTSVRFPEKSLDSHLIHHAFESLSPPMSTLFRRLLFDVGMAATSHVVVTAPEHMQAAVRFEDLHHYPELVMQSICDWLAIEMVGSFSESDLSWGSGERAVMGLRNLTERELTPLIMSYADILKIRSLLAAEYEVWGYSKLCKPNFDRTAQDLRTTDELPITAHWAVSRHEQSIDEALIQEDILREAFTNAKADREGGVKLLPLLFEGSLPAITSKGSL